MKKIETLFVRDGKGREFKATPQVAPGCEWVTAGEGIATRKWDGSCCLVLGGELFKRIDWDAAKGEPPASWFHHDLNPAQRSGHGWMPVGDDPNDTWHREAWKTQKGLLEDGTYELCGPKINKNREAMSSHVLMRHGDELVENCPRDFEGLREFLRTFPHEGIVWHHPDDRMAKIKRRDFWRGQ